ncbi:MAG: hypothetical protein M0T78_06530 [Actinomycetota bacterium]|nr:hypothetical protein [Actinomycetota bacterium]
MDEIPSGAPNQSIRASYCIVTIMEFADTAGDLSAIGEAYVKVVDGRKSQSLWYFHLIKSNNLTL